MAARNTCIAIIYWYVAAIMEYHYYISGYVYWLAIRDLT